MHTQLKNMLIGIFLIAAIGTFVSLVMFLRPSVGDERQVLYVRFSNINKINIGTRVLFAGRPIGEVTQIQQIYHARETQPSDELGRLFFYQLTLKVDSNVKVYNTDQISIQTSGLLGEKSISITPKAPPKGTTPELLTSKAPYYADSIDAIENTFNRLSDIGEKLENTIDLVNSWIVQNQDNLTHAVASIGSTLDQVYTTVKTVNEQQIIPQVKQGTERFASLMQKTESAFDQMNQDGVFSNMGELVGNFKSASFSLDKITQDIAGGSGTLGKLLQGEDLYLRTNAILSKADTMMNDITHYGILFHLNKGWQRDRTKRLTALNALNTPSGFKDYFQTEMDKINTSMSRISMLIDKAQSKSEDQPVLTTPRFKEDFADLLRQVEDMSDNLKLYNQQLMEAIK